MLNSHVTQLQERDYIFIIKQVLMSKGTFQSPALALLRDLDLDLDLDREAAGRSRLTLLSRVRLTDQIRCLVSTR